MNECGRLLIVTCWLALICCSTPSSAVVAEDANTPQTDSASPAESTATTESSAPTTSRIQGRSGFFERLPPRPLKSAAELQAWSEQLRQQYTQSPEYWPEPQVDPGVNWKELGLLPVVRHPDDNPLTKEKYQLGRMLFFDPRLSKSGEMACASCHDPDLSWADGRTVSFGLQRFELARNAPSLLNAGLLETLFWDGRAASLEEQALHVLGNPHEMGSSEQLVIERLGQVAEYREAFDIVFGDGEITSEKVAQAVACFERTLVGGRSKFDQFLKGKPDQLTDSALRGLDLFRREGRCMNCHHGPLLTDHQFHDVGLSYYGRQYEDRGRYEVTGQAEDVGKFRTPSLRNISQTGPYMHNGLFPLPGVLRMYNAGMPTLTPREHQTDDPLFPKKSPLLRPLGLNPQDLTDLQAFLEALEEPRLRHRPPQLPALPARFSNPENPTQP